MFDFLILKAGKGFLDLQHLSSYIRHIRWCLDIRFLLYKNEVFLEIFRDFIYLLRQLHWDRRRKGGNVERFNCVFTLTIGWLFDNLRTELGFYFAPKQHISIIYNKTVPISFIKRQNKPLYCFADTFEVFNVVGLISFDCFTKNIFLYSNKGFLDILDIRH